MGSLDTSMQSDGTLRALTLLPALYYACKQGKTVVVDEINCCLSPTMVKGIVEYFAENCRYQRPAHFYHPRQPAA